MSRSGGVSLLAALLAAGSAAHGASPTTALPASGPVTAIMDAPCRGWVRDLNAVAPDTRERSAQALFRRCDRSRFTAQAEAASRLRAMVGQRDASAVALLLLGDRNDDESVSALRQAAAAGLSVKFEPWLAPVPAALPAAVALARIGTDDDRSALAASAAEQPLATRIFLLHVIGDVQAPPVLRAMLAYLRDEREIADGVPVGATPRRRLCDLAVDAFVRRLKLKPAFALRPAGRYSATEIAAGESAALAALR